MEQRPSRGVEQLATDRQQLPSQSFGAADRLQGIMDEMQQDASGHSSERQALTALPPYVMTGCRRML